MKIRIIIPALAGICLAACTTGERDIGTDISLALTSLPASTAAMPAGSKTFTNLEGTSITLTRAHLTMSSVELTQDCSAVSFAHLPLKALDWILPAAQAHTGNSPTRLGEPHIFDLLGEDGLASKLGRISPPLGEYCGSSWQIAAADDDAIGLSATPDMLGYSLRLAGTWGAETTSFSLDLSLSLLPVDRVIQPSLSLSADQTSASLVLSWRYDQWFDGVDMEALAAGDANARDLLLSNLRSTASLALIAGQAQ